MKNPQEIPFSYIQQNFLIVPVKINDSITKNFILDTGIGVNLISKTLCEQIGCKITGSHTGKRMSGQELTLPISEVESLSLGDVRQTHVPIGVFDMNQLMPGADIGGFISLGFFKDMAFTIDDQKKILTIETNKSLEKIKSTGATVPIAVDQQGVSVSIHMPFILPNGKKISAEVDSGSQALILHDRYMNDLNIQPNDKDVKHKQGKDETGHLFDRYFTKLKGPVQLPGHPDMNVDSINVIFQKIIYDGLVGQYFLRQFIITYDLKNSEMIFRKP